MVIRVKTISKSKKSYIVSVFDDISSDNRYWEIVNQIISGAYKKVYEDSNTERSNT